MTPPPAADVTRLLEAARDGDRTALNRLLPLIYEQLHAIAHRQRARSGGFETINTTALVHEAYEKLVRGDAGWNDRQHFFRVAARVMRSVLVDYARAQHAQKRGGKEAPVSLDVLGGDVPGLRTEEVLGVDEALEKLARIDPEQVQLVELRYFTGLSIPEAAAVLGMSERTAKRRWTVARAWLYRELAA